MTLQSSWVLVGGGCFFGLIFLGGVGGILVSILQTYVEVSEKGLTQFGPFGFRLKNLDWDEITTITPPSVPGDAYEVRSSSGKTITVDSSLPGIELFVAACRLHLSGRVCLTALETPAQSAK